MKTVFISLTAAVGLLAGCAGAGAAPAPRAEAASVANCGVTVAVKAAPQRAIAMEQNATEILLSLGLAGRMAGTSYQTDPVLPALKGGYDSVPVLAKLYPSREKVLEARPDFVYSTFTSAYAGEAAGPRPELAKLGVPAYLSRFACEKDPAAFAFAGLFSEIEEVATLFGVPERGRKLVAGERARLAAALTSKHSGTSLLWYYSGTSTPNVAGPGGVPAAITEQLGAENVYGDAKQTWPAGSWEQIAARNPDVIVLADLTRGGDGDSAQSKIDFLRSNPVTAELDAVRAGRFITVPGSSMDPSVRSVAAVETVGAGLAELGR
ncbi:ABC transporter substrate-binding protein [Actinoplanes sp. NPDC048988]|uniref:ABC transporter substrate-binding protein n=1 Tax=Actinoplanes sp. NPDC048988 TaxID=3363901 RepID=UPI00372160BC